MADPVPPFTSGRATRTIAPLYPVTYRGVARWEGDGLYSIDPSVPRTALGALASVYRPFPSCVVYEAYVAGIFLCRRPTRKECVSAASRWARACRWMVLIPEVPDHG